jgi:tetratricopeptide (TPR) repeat protein
MAKKKHHGARPKDEIVPDEQARRADKPGRVPKKSVGAKTAAASEPSREAFSFRWRAVYAAIPALLAFATSFNTVFNQFASDDSKQVLGNTFIRDIANLPLAFTTSVWSYVTEDIAGMSQPYYRPLFSVLFTLNYTLFGTKPWGWHLVNVLIHTGVALLVFLNVKELSRRNWLALIAASLFAVHPAHAESVAWISGVTDPLMSLFVLGSLLLYFKYEHRRSRLLMVALLFVYFLGLQTKETAIALPVVVLYHEFVESVGVRALKESIKRSVTAAGLFLIPTAFYLLMRESVLGSVFFSRSGARYPVGPSLMTVPPATIKYLKLLLIPVGYSYQHYTPLVEAATSARFLVPLAALLVIAGLIVATKSRLVWFATIWFIATLGPALAAIPNFDPEYVVQERYLYLPSIGFCVVLAICIDWLAGRLNRPGVRWTAPLVSVGLISVFGVASIKQNRVWRDTRSLFANCVAVAPDSAIAHSSYSGTLFSEGQRDAAEAETRRALELDPHCTTAYLNLSYFAHTKGRIDDAIGYLKQATETIPVNNVTRGNLATAYVNLGLMCQTQKDAGCAESSLLRSIELWPRPTGYYYAGEFYSRERRWGEARVMYERAAELVPATYAPIYLRLGAVYEQLKERDLARAAYEKYLLVAPANAKERTEVNKLLSK